MSDVSSHVNICEAQADIQSEPVRAGTRERKPTEKGLQYEIAICERKFKAAVSMWRSSVSKMSVLLSDETDLNLIRDGRNSLDRSMNDVDTTFCRLRELHGSEMPEIRGIAEIFENLEEENQKFMCKIADRICDIQLENVETGSRFSVQSSRSSLSRRSRSSNFSRRSDTAAEAAALKAKLKYIDAEAKSKAELEKIMTRRKLEMAQAKLGALDEDSVDSLADLDFEPKLPVFQDDRESYTNGYVKTHSHVSSADVKLPMNNSHSQHSIPINVGVNAAFQTCTLGESKACNASSLNPTAESFLPSHSQQTESVLSPPIAMATQTSTNMSVMNGPTTLVQNSSVHETNGNDTRREILELTKTLAEHVSLSRLPPPEPNVFDGDPLKYPGWKSAFHTLIEQKRIPPSEKIHYLRKYLGGSVREVVENFFLLTTEDAYEEAKKLLDQRYGDPFIIGNAFRDKLENWPKIQSRDGHGLQRFADFLKQCHTAMESINCLGILDDDRENRKLLVKIPEWVVNRWSRYVAQWKEQKGKFPPFKEFMQFMVKEAKIACDPVTSLQSLKIGQGCSSMSKADNYAKQYKRLPLKGRSFATEVKDNFGSATFNAVKPDRKECVLCQKSHDIDVCKEFLAKAVENRKALARKKGFCFGCLCSGHVANRCRQRKRCEKCNKLHPTSLHGDKISPEPLSQKDSQVKESQSDIDRHSSPLRGVSFMNYAGSCRMSSMILPVYISHEGRSNTERLVYALLDSQSDTTFVLEHTCKALGVSGVEVDLLLSTMYAENKVVKSRKINGLTVRGFKHSLKLSLPVAYTRQIMPANRSHIPTPEMARKWPYLEHISSELMPIQDCEVGLLIGYNCARALMPRDVIAPDKNGPYAQNTDLGWGIVGIVDTDSNNQIDLDPVGVSHRVLVCEVDSSLSVKESSGINADHVLVSFRNKVKEAINPMDVVRMMGLDFVEHKGGDVSLSVEDKHFLDIMKAGIKRVDGHYEMPLPLRDKEFSLPKNKAVALHRLTHLKRRLRKDKQYLDHYCSFMQEMFSKGYAERVPKSALNRNDGSVWYIPHHGIYHSKKPEKIRVVFDCSATFMGESLNSHLLQGPDLTNTLVGVLCRFRKESVAFMCDIEQMFFQFRVSPSQRDLLRFLWWENNDFDEEPIEYRMCVHLFGAASSPGCANFGLKQIASDYEDDIGSDVSNFVRRDIYVDDGLTSVPTDEKAMSLITRSKEMCSKGGLKLHKILSSSKSVLQQIPPGERAKGFVNVDLLNDTLPIERALGVQWCIESDCFQFRITLSDRPLTRRGVLSTVSSVYDPLGFISPVVLVGKQILQQLCADQTNWDSPMPESLRSKWERWRNDLHNLGSLEIKRCFKPKGFGKVVTTELHHFSDASQCGYGQCSYVRLVDDTNEVHCSLIMSKARVAPLKPVTIPRLELTAALTSVRISASIQRELDFIDTVEWYWTDSKVVLGYIANDSRRFHVYVANRVQQIHDHTDPSQWRYVDTKENPADIASRGVSADHLINRSRWFVGPEFLWEPELLSHHDEIPTLSPDDRELKNVQVFNTQTDAIGLRSFCENLKYFSSWVRLKKAVALCLTFIKILRKRIDERSGSQKQNRGLESEKDTSFALSVGVLIEAEKAVVKAVQSEVFDKEISFLKGVQVDGNSSDRQVAKKHKSLLKGHSSLYRLDPFLDSTGILRVGGRVRRAQMDMGVKHPAILPKKGHITELVISHFHKRVNHQGRGMTSNEIRANGFWIVGLSAAVSSFISHCVICRRLRGSTQVQKMADLPEDRLEPSPPFTYSGVDYFGPWYIREGRKEMKRYGVIFTCLCCRAVHLETAVSLSTDSFINALRRFLAIRGPIRELRSDRGTNFVGAKRELADAVAEMDENHIRQFLLKEGCDYFVFNMNVPNASHMGGVWERQIHSVKNVLSSLLYQHGSQLDDESLRTFMCEAAAIVNSRPLSVQNVNDPLSMDPLTPNNLLTMKSKIILPPPGQFQRTDLYSRKRWRRIQYLANEFWSRWRKEYLQTLQVRNKWVHSKRNSCVEDIVLISDENLPRNQWHLGKIVEANPDQYGLVRKVKVAVGTTSLDNKGKRTESLSYLERPIHKLVLLYETELVP